MMTCLLFPFLFFTYSYLIGCDNELAKLHTSHPEACDKVGGVIIMHIDDLRKFALLWLHKTEEVRADRAHYARNITGDIYESGWISEMYGYSFGAAEVFCFKIFTIHTQHTCLSKHKHGRQTQKHRQIQSVLFKIYIVGLNMFFCP